MMDGYGILYDREDRLEGPALQRLMAAEATPAGTGAAALRRPVNIVFELDGAQQWIYRMNRAEDQRVGVRLTEGGGA